MGGPGRLNATDRVFFRVYVGGGRRERGGREDTRRRGANCTRAGLLSPRDAARRRQGARRSGRTTPSPRRISGPEPFRASKLSPRRWPCQNRVDDARRRRVLDFFGRGGDRGAREKRCEGDHACEGACVSRGVASAAANLVLTEALTLKNAFARGPRRCWRRMRAMYVQNVPARDLTRRGQRLSSCRSDCCQRKPVRYSNGSQRRRGATSTPYNAIQEIRKEAFSQPVSGKSLKPQLWAAPQFDAHQSNSMDS